MARQLSTTTLKILEILNDCHVHTGSALATKLGISRTAIWKVIKRLKSYDIPIKTQRLGYQLEAPLILLDKKKIIPSLKELNANLEIFESLSSTNDYLKDKKIFQENSCFCFAEHQSKGRGRMGRVWASPFGRNIYFSFSYMFNKDITDLSGLSLVIGILVIKALETLNEKLKLTLKWPNDIYSSNKKIGGILIDMVGEVHGNCRAIIGIGLNVNMKNIILDSVNQPWSSLENLLDTQLDRNIIASRLIKTLLEGLKVFLKEGFKPFYLEWGHYDELQGKTVLIKASQSTVTGISRGIDQEGHLLLELSNGSFKHFSYGDVSLSNT